MPDLCLPLLQTCRLAHWEAALISFSSNRFVLKASSPANYQLFLDRLMPAQRAAIRSLRLVFNDFHHALPQSFALALPKTTDLAISIPGDFNSFMTNVYSPWELVEKLQRWPLDRVSVSLSRKLHCLKVRCARRGVLIISGGWLHWRRRLRGGFYGSGTKRLSSAMLMESGTLRPNGSRSGRRSV